MLSYHDVIRTLLYLLAAMKGAGRALLAGLKIHQPAAAGAGSPATRAICMHTMHARCLSDPHCTSCTVVALGHSQLQWPLMRNHHAALAFAWGSCWSVVMHC